ncbi:hypothetical protein [Pantoea sp. At-9b]|nr:hypothetical protein [Pantoea sp. At-9b]ADU71530.1 hypothetical protein Pat9b_5373 [Pantoea sp. At-9b]
MTSKEQLQKQGKPNSIQDIYMKAGAEVALKMAEVCAKKIQEAG